MEQALHRAQDVHQSAAPVGEFDAIVIPGKPRVFMPYVAGLDKYRKTCKQIAQDGYRGFALSR